ncbi:MAG: glycosyltransferase family 2 protein [Bauldia sp.]|nr:glycosyltransferase family 2 protein [Bauldia sp.]
MSAARPAVGVVIPVRNGARTLAAAIASVLGQSPPPDDVVVVDGGSDDGSASSSLSLGVRVIAQEGRGLGAARNQGIAAVAGDLVAFCDVDDRWTDGALAMRLARLAAEPACGAVIGHLRRTVIGDETPTPQQASRLGQVEPGYTPGALLVRRAALAAVGPFDETLTLGCDSDWFVRLVQSAVRLDVLPDTVLLKGVRNTSLSTDIATYRRELLQVARGFIDRRRRETP